MEKRFGRYFQRLKPTVRFLRELVAEPYANAKQLADEFVNIFNLAKVELGTEAELEKERECRNTVVAQHEALE